MANNCIQAESFATVERIRRVVKINDAAEEQIGLQRLVSG